MPAMALSKLRTPKSPTDRSSHQLRCAMEMGPWPSSDVNINVVGFKKQRLREGSRTKFRQAWSSRGWTSLSWSRLPWMLTCLKVQLLNLRLQGAKGGRRPSSFSPIPPTGHLRPQALHHRARVYSQRR